MPASIAKAAGFGGAPGGPVRARRQQCRTRPRADEFLAHVVRAVRIVRVVDDQQRRRRHEGGGHPDDVGVLAIFRRWSARRCSPPRMRGPEAMTIGRNVQVPEVAHRRQVETSRSMSGAPRHGQRGGLAPSERARRPRARVRVRRRRRAPPRRNSDDRGGGPGRGRPAGSRARRSKAITWCPVATSGLGRTPRGAPGTAPAVYRGHTGGPQPQASPATRWLAQCLTGFRWRTPAVCAGWRPPRAVHHNSVGPPSRRSPRGRTGPSSPRARRTCGSTAVWMPGSGLLGHQGSLSDGPIVLGVS